MPIAANAGYYADIVREKAVLRRLVDAGTRIVQIGYAGEGDVDDIVDSAQAEVYAITEKRNSEDYAPLSEIMAGVLDEIEAIGNRDAGLYGVPTGFADLDELTNGLHAGQMIIVAARPGAGKSTIALDLCRAASIHNNLATAFFSLEMTRSEITMRLLSAEAKVPLNHIRNGNMSDDDWTKLARKMGEVSSAPMFIDDSPNMTMMEIRAKARRLKQRHDLKLMVIDYMQLMTSGKKVESRQLEVSEFSRQIKLLAKELGIPIIALSQLNRGPEQRSDKRPMLSDLRESGCLTADTRLMRADTNAEITLGELLAGDVRDIPVWSLDDRLKLVPRTLTHAFPSGTKQVFELTLASGRRVHGDGQPPVPDLRRLDAARRAERRFAGRRRSGTFRRRSRCQPTRRGRDRPAGPHARRRVVREAPADPLRQHRRGQPRRGRRGGRSAVRDHPGPRRLRRRAGDDAAAAGAVPPHARQAEPDRRLARRGRPVRPAQPREVRAADWVFALPKEQVGLFLRHIWATDGSVGYDEKHGWARVYYASTSRRLVDDLARLLLRFNVFTRIKRVRKAGYRDGWHLYVYGVENQLRFCDEIGVHGARGDAGARTVASSCADVVPNTNLDTIPEPGLGPRHATSSASRR